MAEPASAPGRSVADIRRGVWRSTRALPPTVWLLAVLVTTGTNLLDFVTIPAAGARPGPAFLVAAAARVGLVFWLGWSLTRLIAGTARPLTPRRSLAAYIGFSLLLAIGIGAALRLATGSGPPPPLAREWLESLVVGLAWQVLTVRLIAVGAAIALDRPVRALPAVLRAGAGTGGPLAAVLLQLIAPFFALHLALTLLAVRLPLSGPAVAALALIDGLVSAVQLLLSCALAVVAWRLAEPALHGDAAGR